MSLDDIELPGWLVANLYKNTLIGRESVMQATQLTQGSKTMRFLGNNDKHIVLVVKVENAVFLPDNQLGFIIKMLEACKLNLADVAILNLASTDMQIELIKEQFKPEILILFGPEPSTIGLPFNTPFFQIQSHDSCRYVYAPALVQLSLDTEESKLLKGKLWMCLKLLFELF
jgi:hypothetical protein